MRPCANSRPFESRTSTETIDKDRPEPFFTTKAPGKGTGLGLASVYGIVKQSDGLVYVDSRLGEGTRVRIYLPLVEGEVIDHSVVSAAPTVASGSETVLLVEDSEPVRAFVERCLRADGYEVLSFRAPGAAFDHAFAAGESIDVLLTDIVMPGISGLDLAERLRRDRPDLPVLLMTGHARDSDNSGPDPILRKPFTRAELNHALRRVLDEGGSRSRLT